MADTKPTFEENLAQLEQIVAQLEKGDVPLEQAMTQFQAGVSLSQKLDKTLKEAETAVTKVMTADGELKSFDPNDNAK